jgi:hypothetical protein
MRLEHRWNDTVSVKSEIQEKKVAMSFDQLQCENKLARN